MKLGKSISSIYLSYKLTRNEINQAYLSTQERDLGVVIAEDLRWKEHT